MGAPSTTAAGRFGLNAAALLCAALQLGGALHLLIVEHVHCAEHGELTHAHGEHGEHTLAAASTDDGHGDADAFTAGEHDSAGHEHCPLANLTRAELDAPCAAPCPCSAPETTAAAMASGVGPAIATLLSAPKTSPPA